MPESLRRALIATLLLATANFSAQAAPPSPAAEVNPLIGSRNGGNTFPGATLPFGMLQWSPENTKGQHDRTAAPGGYQYDATRIRGFSLTHLSGTGCAGASGDIPFMPVIDAPDTNDANLYVQSLTRDGKSLDQPWLPTSFAEHGGHLRFALGAKPDTHWGSDATDAPPSFPPPEQHP